MFSFAASYIVLLLGNDPLVVIGLEYDPLVPIALEDDLFIYSFAG